MKFESVLWRALRSYSASLSYKTVQTCTYPSFLCVYKYYENSMLGHDNVDNVDNKCNRIFYKIPEHLLQTTILFHSIVEK